MLACWCNKTLMHVVQSVRKGKADQGKYHALMKRLLADVKQRAAAGQLLSSSVAGHLLNVRCGLIAAVVCLQATRLHCHCIQASTCLQRLSWR